jgi:hypothetical protein
MYARPFEKNSYFCPVNLLLIAPAECGKTRLLKGIFAKKTLELMDISPKLIVDKLIPQIEKKDVSTLIIPDLIQLVGHKKNTSDSTIAFLNALIEEGIKDSLFNGMEFHLKERVFCGLMTAITPSEFYLHLKKWNGIGFLHRLLPVSYDYCADTIRKIHDEIASGQMFYEIEKLNFNPKNPIKIKIPHLLSGHIQLLVDETAKKLGQFVIKKQNSVTRKLYEIKFDIKGFRLHDRLRQIARAICLVDGKGRRKEVNVEDILKLKELCEIINLPNTTKLI